LLWDDRTVRNIPSAVRRIGYLCGNLETDGTLRGELLAAGLSSGDWDLLVAAMRQGKVDALTPLLDAVEAAAESACVDGVTFSTREYRPLRSAKSPAPISGWRCPHAIRCGRAEVRADPKIERRCALTGDPLEWASVTSQ
jgi:hypothetical protein